MSIDFDNRMGAGDVERIVAEIEADVRATLPQVVRLFIRPLENPVPGRGPHLT